MKSIHQQLIFFEIHAILKVNNHDLLMIMTIVKTVITRTTTTEDNNSIAISSENSSLPLVPLAVTKGISGLGSNGDFVALVQHEEQATHLVLSLLATCLVTGTHSKGGLGLSVCFGFTLFA